MRDIVKNLESTTQAEGYAFLYFVFSSAPGLILIVPKAIVIIPACVTYGVAFYLFKKSFRVLFRSKSIAVAVIGHCLFTIGISVFLWDNVAARAAPALSWIVVSMVLYSYYVVPNIDKLVESE